MVAVVSGAGLGLFGSSASTLGGAGANGSANLGRSGERVYVNTATGNLIVQHQDEQLSALGLDIALLRTYNSQGLLNDDNGDNWRLGIHQQVYGLTGTLNAVNSTITKVFGDGREVVCRYDTALSYYVGTDGDGAHDTLKNTSGTWTWTDGSGRSTETYNADGQFTQSRDNDLNTVTYTYTGALLTQVTDASNQITYLDYTGTNLTQIRVVSGTPAQTQTLTRYTYDTSNRLTQVRVDISPEDNSIADNQVYTTTYTYDGASKRIASIAQSDESSVSFTYELVGGVYCVKTYSENSGVAVNLSANRGALTTAEPVTTTTDYGITTGAITPQGWTGPTPFPVSYSPKLGSDENGNAFAAWISDSGATPDVQVSRFDSVSRTWSPVLTLDTGDYHQIDSVELAVDAQGNALVAWVHTNGSYYSTTDPRTVYAQRYDAATNSWGTSQAVTTHPGVIWPITASINGNRAALSFEEKVLRGTKEEGYVVAVRYNAGTWSAPDVIDSESADYHQLNSTTSAMDASGNIIVMWTDRYEMLYARRFNAAAGTWDARHLITIPIYGTGTVGNIRLLMPDDGNAIAVYHNGAQYDSQTEFARYDVLSDTWALSPSSAFVNRTDGTNSVWADRAGNAFMLTYSASGTSLAMRLYDPVSRAWGDMIALPTTGINIGLSVTSASIRGDKIRLRYFEGTAWHLAEFADGVWSARGDFTFTNAQSTLAMVTPPDGTIMVLSGTTNQFSTEPGQLLVYNPDNSYLIPAGATWASVATALYGIAAAADTLQAAMASQPLTAGTRLRNLPSTLAVSTTTMVPVTPYYVVLRGDSWANIAQSVYGASDSNVITVLRNALGDPPLVAGAHIVMPLTLTATPVGRVSTLTYTAGAISTSTDVLSPLGLLTTYTQDAAGRLTSVLSPTVSGARLETRYAYDVDGNLTSITEDPTGLNRVTTFGYDTRGNLLLSRDSLGNTITRTYTGTNQVLTEVTYLVSDPDGAGAGTPSGPLTKRFVYDAEDHLRYEISADGRVVEHYYNTAGQLNVKLTYTGALYTATSFTLANLQSWGTPNKNSLQRLNYAYDFRGNLSSISAFATTLAAGTGSGTASITRFVYDQRGCLLQTIDPRGSANTPNPATPNLPYATTYTYDGLGRVLTASQWNSTSLLSTTLTAYDDANRRTITTLANGLVTSSLYNRNGELTSVVKGAGNSLGTTTYTYDMCGRLRMVSDPRGVKQFYLYDEAGRKIAQIDGDGSLTEFIYDRASAVIKTIKYSTLLNAAAQASLIDSSGNPANVALATLRTSANATPATNRIARNVYDAAGLLVFTIAEVGAVTQFLYDGAKRITDEVCYATTVTVPAATNQVLPGDLTSAMSPIRVITSANDRRTRNYYDGAGLLLGTLDGGGYLVEFVYDNGGRLIKQIGYANQSDPAQWLTGTLTLLRPAADTETAVDPERDIVSYFFYDGQGRKIGVLDAEGYLTETTYDLAGNIAQVKRYDRVLTYTAGTSTFATLKTTANGASTQTTSYQYDGSRHVTQETNFEGTITSYTYDSVGNLLATTRALGTVEARTSEARYDFLGRVTQELSAAGRAQITAGMTQAQIDDIWTRYGVSHAYDVGGRRISSTLKPNDTQANVTRYYYYYDNDDRLRFEVNQLGEVKEYRYSALNQLSSEISYVGRITTTGQIGGLLTPALITTLTAAQDFSSDVRTTYTYSLTGKRASVMSGMNVGATFTFNAFGETAVSLQPMDATRSIRKEHTYNTRGQLTLTRSDPAALNYTEARQYDAFGRLTQATDARNNTSRIEYDRLGRQIATVDALGGRRTTTYDAFSRVLTLRDALNQQTTYSYNDATRSMTVTTPENIAVTTVHTRHGQMLTVLAAGKTTTYTYDPDGNLTGISDNTGTLESRSYDRGGRQITTTGSQDTVTTLAYDAANRVLSRKEDSASSGLTLTTVYTYDGAGRVFNVLEPSGRSLRLGLDKDGRSYLDTVNNSGLNLRTAHSYDQLNNVVTLVEGSGTAAARRTTYVFDALGRRIEEIVDPTASGGTLNLRAQYKYDANDNVTRKIDANGNSIWYVYDANNRLTHTIDALGGVTQTTYDAAGQVTAVRRYATALSAATMTTLASLDSPTTANFSTAIQTADRVTRSFYDGDGREKYTIDSNGAVTERIFDANSNVTRTRLYGAPLLTGTYADSAAVTTALGVAAGTLDAADRVTWTAYDLRGRAAFSVDGSGAVTQLTYDNADNVIARAQFVTPRATTAAMDLTSLQSFATANAANAQNRTTHYWYDSTDRLRFTLDAEGYLSEKRYNDAGRGQTDIVYAAKPVIAAGATLATVVTAASAVASAGYDQSTLTQFDLGGRVSKVTDAIGGYEQYTYDAVGNKLTYRNAAGSIWNYVYDIAGRLLEERSPSVAVTLVSESGSTLVSDASTVSIVTRMTYDALGNVKTRTEGIRRFSDNTESTVGSRTTIYVYDTLGRQLSTVFPAVDVYSGSFTDFTGATIVQSMALSSQVTYDASGNVTRNLDVAGKYSYKVYDALGRVRYEIDALKYVTEHTYDAFGNERTLTRFAKALGTLPAFAENRIALSAMDSAVAGLRSNTENRVIAKTYDRLNRVESTQQPQVFAFELTATVGQSFTAAPTTYFQYDAFGQLIREWQLLNTLGVAVVNPAVNSNANAWASTHYFYDKRGLKVFEVDALRYVTAYEYDESGDMTRKREFARALATFDPTSATQPAIPVPAVPPNTPQDPAAGISTEVGYDRNWTYVYDKLNRNTSEILLNVEYAFINGVILEKRVGNVTKSFGYNAVGNQTSVTESANGLPGLSTYTYYDVLGRVIAVGQPSHDRGDGTVLVPLTEMKRDAYGNLVEEIRYGAGAASLNATTYTLAATTPAVERHTFLRLDTQGKIRRSQDAAGSSRFAAYNARGEVVKEWQDVTNRALADLGQTSTSFLTETQATINEYDDLGRRLVTHEVQSPGGTPTVTHTRAQYNAFGEVTQKQVDGGWAAEYYHYDNGGRVWRTNSGDGVDKVYLYDLNGHATAEIRSRTVDLASATYTTPSSVNNLASTMRTETKYDALGQVVERRLPQFDVVAAADLIDAQPTIAVLPTPNPPNAVYTQFSIDGYKGWGSAGYVLAPSAWTEGGGYYEVTPPSAANPHGTYARVAQAGYSLSQVRQFSWQQPGGVDVTATLQYWPLSNPAAVTSVVATPITVGSIGVNINALSGDYGYRINYRRTGAGSDFARQEGTFNTATGQVTRGASTALQTQTVRPTTTQTLDRWGNVIAAKNATGDITQYRYNQLNQLTLTLLPSVLVLDTISSIEERVTRPQLSNFYDLRGQLIESIDANGNTTRALYNSVGELTRQANADDTMQVGGSKKSFVYDIYGNVIEVTDELGYRTRNVYDKANNLVQVAREIELGGFANGSPTDTTASNAAKIASDYYSYDQAGRRIAETNAEGESIKYWYDLRGNLVRRRTPRNFDTTYQYDAFDRQTRETDANLTYSTWNYDAFGRLTGHREMVNTGPQAAIFQAGGATYSYTYDEAGLITLQTNDLGQRRAFTYDAAGHLGSLTDNGTATAGSGLVSSNRVSTYTYDVAGRQAREKVVVDGRVHQDTRIEYDAMGRITSLDDVDYRLTYSYDANGNRTLIKATYLDHRLVAKNQELYYRYDAMNRVAISQGMKTGGAVPDLIVNGTQGVQLTYNARGERTSVRTQGTRFQITEYVTNGMFQYRTVAHFTPTDGLGSEYYAYDGLGRMTTLERETDKIIIETTTNETVGSSWTSEPVSVRTYDKASRLLTDTSSFVEGSNLVNRTTSTVYDDDGRSITQTTAKAGVTESIVTFGDATTTLDELHRGYDAASVLRGYKVDVYQNGAYRYTTTYVNSYRLGEGYTETGQSATSAGTGAPLAGSTTRIYNVNNELVKFVDSRDVARTRYFANNAAGQALTAIQGQFDGVLGRMTLSQAWDAAVNRTAWAGNYNHPKGQHFFLAAGNYVGSFGQLKDASNAFEANFDVNYTPISDDYPASVPSQVIAQAGDTLRSVAARIFGDAALWYVIAEVNGLSDPDAALTEGATLKVPNDVVSLANTANSFKPFDARAAIGDTSPTQPAPPMPKPKKKGCGVLGTILVIVVAVVVTYFTAGLATTAIGGALGSGATATAVAGVAGAAVGAAAGSIASQGVAIAIGQQDSFSWKSVAAAAISAGLAPGASTLSGSLGSQVAAAALNSAVNQGVNMALGLQDKFNWAAVAASAVAAPIANRLGDKAAAAGKTFNSSFAADVASGLTVGAVNQLAYASFSGGRINYTQLAADVFGNALGNSIVDGMTPQPIGITSEQWADVDRQLSAEVRASQAGVMAGVRAENAIALNKNPDFFANLPMPTAEYETDVFGGRNPFAGARLVNSYDDAVRNFYQQSSAAIDAAARAPQSGLYMQFAPEVYERGAAAVARGRSPEVALNNWLSDRRMPQSSLARDLTVANQMMGEFKGIVLDELAYQGGLADQEGRTAAFVWNGVQSTFVDMFLPGSVPELVIGAAGGVVIGKGVGLAATQLPKVVPILGADVGYSLSKGLTLATDEITYTLRSPVYLDYAPGQLNSGIPLAPQNPIVRTVTGETSATSGGRAVHASEEALRRASGQFDLVNQALVDAAGNPVQVARRVDLTTGQPIASSGLQSARPDAVRFESGGVVVDDKPLGRPLYKDRQQIIRYINAYQQSTGTLPRTIGIQRYNPMTGQPVVTELYVPADFLPKQ